MRGLDGDEVAALGYQLILGNTYHLFVSPGPERIAAAGGLHGFMNWDRALITDSGGFQVFSLAHGGVANEVKGSGREATTARRSRSPRRAPASARPRDGRELFISPEVSMEVQAALGADIALAFDECTPFHADRDYTARSTERTHRWLDRCIAWHGRTGRSARRSSASSRAAPTRTCGANRPSTSRPPTSTASRSAAPSGATRRRWPRSWR